MKIWIFPRFFENHEMENDYHSPYDHQQDGGGGGGHESDHLNHYEAPSCLARNPSGSLYIPSGKKLDKVFSGFNLNFDMFSLFREIAQAKKAII